MFFVDLLRIVSGLILVLFIPGYALTWAVFPKKEEKNFLERIGLSFVLSITSVMLSVIFIDVILGMDTTSVNIFFTILIVTAIAAIIWKIETAYMYRSPEKKKKNLLLKFNLKDFFGKKGRITRIKDAKNESGNNNEFTSFDSFEQSKNNSAEAKDRIL